MVTDQLRLSPFSSPLFAGLGSDTGSVHLRSTRNPYRVAFTPLEKIARHHGIFRKPYEFTRTGLGVNSYGLGTRTFGKNFHELSTSSRETEQSYGAIGVGLNGIGAEAVYSRFTNGRSIDLPYGADERQTDDWFSSERR